MNLMGQSGLRSEPVHQAFQAIFVGNRSQALAKAEHLPLSVVSKIQKLALSSAEELTVNGLERRCVDRPSFECRFAPACKFSKVFPHGAYQFGSGCPHLRRYHSFSRCDACFRGSRDLRILFLAPIVETLTSVCKCNERPCHADRFGSASGISGGFAARHWANLSNVSTPPLAEVTQGFVKRKRRPYGSKSRPPAVTMQNWEPTFWPNGISRKRSRKAFASTTIRTDPRKS